MDKIPQHANVTGISLLFIFPEFPFAEKGVRTEIWGVHFKCSGELKWSFWDNIIRP